MGPRDHGVGAGAVRAAQDRAEVARLLDALEHDHERVGGQVQRHEREVGHGDRRHQALGPVAVGKAIQHRPGHGDHGRTSHPGTLHDDDGVRREGRLDREHLDHPCASVERASELADTIHEGQPGGVPGASFAQVGGRPDSRVLRAADDGAGVGERHAGGSADGAVRPRAQRQRGSRLGSRPASVRRSPRPRSARGRGHPACRRRSPRCGH